MLGLHTNKLGLVRIDSGEDIPDEWVPDGHEDEARRRREDGEDSPITIQLHALIEKGVADLADTVPHH